jgi:predicted ATP-grasp superfamily ATP-dependent carboligase
VTAPVPDQVPVLVTDGEQRAALAVVRSLGKAGYAPIVCARERRALAAASRYAAGIVHVPDPLRDPAAFLDTVARTIRECGIRVVVPVAEPSCLALLGNADRLGGAVIAGPELDAFRGISDKEHMLAVAREVGLATPAQLRLERQADASAAALDALLYPVVLKPTLSVRGGRIHSVSYAADAGALRERLAAIPESAFPLLVQQRIVGPGTGIFLLRWDDRILATFAHRRLRETPPSGGASVYSESVPADPELVAGATRLLERFRWRGAAMLELKRDAATGVAYVMEVNGRLWGSLQLAIGAGVDFPRLLVDAALGRPVAANPPYRSGVRLRWWWGDVNHVLVRLRHSGERLALPPNAPTRGRLLRDFLRWRRADRSETLRLDDPRPFLVDTARWLAAYLRR